MIYILWQKILLSLIVMSIFRLFKTARICLSDLWLRLRGREHYEVMCREHTLLTDRLTWQ